MTTRLDGLTDYIEHLSNILRVVCEKSLVEPPEDLQRFLAKQESPDAPAPTHSRIRVGEMDGVPLFVDESCPKDKLVIEREGEAIAALVLHPTAEVLSPEARKALRSHLVATAGFGGLRGPHYRSERFIASSRDVTAFRDREYPAPSSGEGTRTDAPCSVTNNPSPAHVHGAHCHINCACGCGGFRPTPQAALADGTTEGK